MRKILGVLAVAVGLGGCDQMMEDQMAGIHSQVAEDAEAQYRIASSSGSAMDKCVQAGLVSAAYLQAQDENQYQRWKAIEQTDCTAAGLPN